MVYEWGTPLTRRFAAPSPAGRGSFSDHNSPLPPGEGGAKRRVRGVPSR